MLGGMACMVGMRCALWDEMPNAMRCARWNEVAGRKRCVCWDKMLKGLGAWCDEILDGMRCPVE